MPAVQIEEEAARARPAASRGLAVELGLSGASCRVESGNVKSEIVRVARERRADLIILGSRERHGLSILVNLTEDTVLHDRAVRRARDAQPAAASGSGLLIQVTVSTSTRDLVLEGSWALILPEVPAASCGGAHREHVARRGVQHRVLGEIYQKSTARDARGCRE